MQCVKHRQDDDMTWMEGKDRLKSITHETASLIKTVTGFNLNLDEEGDRVNIMNAWENGLNKARMEAKKVWRNKGRVEGRAEGQMDIMTAIRMIKDDKPTSAICEATGLSNERLTELRSML